MRFLSVTALLIICGITLAGVTNSDSQQNSAAKQSAKQTTFPSHRRKR